MGVAFTHEKPPMKRSRINPKREEPRRTSAEKDSGYVDWLHENCRCVACVAAETRGMRSDVYPFGRVEGAHTKNNGMASKGPDSSRAPLCVAHHSEQHTRGVKVFEEKYGLDLEHEAATHYATFLIWKESVAECA